MVSICLVVLLSSFLQYSKMAVRRVLVLIQAASLRAARQAHARTEKEKNNEKNYADEWGWRTGPLAPNTHISSRG
jgi:hypothetical protein